VKRVSRRLPGIEIELRPRSQTFKPTTTFSSLHHCEALNAFDMALLQHKFIVNYEEQQGELYQRETAI
jgi:hypothetical protein